MNMEILGKRIRQLRLQSGLTEEEVARKLGISVQAYKRTEVGNRNIPVRDIYELSRILGVPYQEITDVDEEEAEKQVAFFRNAGLSPEQEEVVDKVYQILDILAAQEALYLRFAEGD